MEQKANSDKSRAGSRSRTPRALRIIIAGGGTGGHLFPAIAIAQEFVAANPGNRVCFVSTGNDFERSTLARAVFRLECITAEGIKGRGVWRQLRAAVKIPMGILESIRMIKRFQPDLVVGVGSYAAGPVAMGAWLMGTRIVLHEQNILPGITNRILSRFAHRIYVSFEATGKFFSPGKTRVTGNPVRREILESGKRKAKNGAGDKSSRPFTVLIVGGSQGAHRINLTVMDAVHRLQNRDRYFFIHQTGGKDASMVADAYKTAGCACEVKPFFEDMAACYRKADLVICRAGATTVAEVTALGKAVIFIPFPHAADNHQLLNARSLSDNGAAETIEESQLAGRPLDRVIEYYASNPETREQMASRARRFGNPEAAAEIVRDCYRLLDTTYPQPETRNAKP